MRQLLFSFSTIVRMGESWQSFCILGSGSEGLFHVGNKKCKIAISVRQFPASKLPIRLHTRPINHRLKLWQISNKIGSQKQSNPFSCYQILSMHLHFSINANNNPLSVADSSTIKQEGKRS
ncbi:unnamed protein product [Lactuca virosa]|uniref:Uncharacterized protein n=1 Tax=Lactuca virosa TaxID=75947 RepID=A0AAU9N739_9ASTR|nr:unnamed protein product [Lactuca virosa]